MFLVQRYLQGGGRTNMSKKYMQDGLTLDEQLAIAYGAPATGFGLSLIHI